MKTQVLIERLDLSEALINSEERTIRQKIIQAGMSANKRHYSEAVLQSAASLFEGVKTYANHPGKLEQRNRPERSVRDITGWLEGVEYKDNALWATRKFAATQAGQDTWAIVEQVVSGTAPAGLIGGSINAVGKARKDKVDGQDAVIVESIDAVNSVDDVTTPAAGGGFTLESASDTLTGDLLGLLTYEEWFESRPEYTKRLQNEMKKIRQTDAVKAAKAEADQHSQALHDAQQEIQSLREQHEAALADAASARREVLLERALVKVSLPATWKDGLRKQLLDAESGQWDGIISSEVSKAKSANATPKVAVTGADYREAAQPNLPDVQPNDILPRDGETAEQWAQRMAQSKQR